jgi:hypothetical protein
MAKFATNLSTRHSIKLVKQESGIQREPPFAVSFESHYSGRISSAVLRGNRLFHVHFGGELLFINNEVHDKGGRSNAFPNTATPERSYSMGWIDRSFCIAYAPPRPAGRYGRMTGSISVAATIGFPAFAVRRIRKRGGEPSIEHRCCLSASRTSSRGGIAHQAPVQEQGHAHIQETR